MRGGKKSSPAAQGVISGRGDGRRGVYADSSPESLFALTDAPTDHDERARHALRLLGAEPPNWVVDRDGVDHNVFIVGGGQTGATFAFALRRAGIGRLTIVDKAPSEDQAGIWLTRARMNQLRTPKTLPGPELGIPELGFQAWYEARHGEGAFAGFNNAPRTAWAAYLKWYRDFLGIPIRYGVRLDRVEPAGDHFRLHLEIDGKATVETARKIILANGLASSGGPIVPEVLRGLPESHLAHTADAIDFAAHEGQSIAVVGAAASAFDAAATALEAGAANVHLFARRVELASVPINRVRGYPGAYENYALLSDATRWRQALRFRDAGSTAPPEAIERAVRHRNFHLHVGAPWITAKLGGGRVATTVNGESFAFDFVIAGTGYFADPRVRPELRDFADAIRLWQDQYLPPAGEEDAYFGAHPYLGPGHEYLERAPGTAPFLADIHVYNPSGFVSFGLPIGDVPSIRRDIPAIVRRINHDLFFADIAAHEARITGSVPAEFDESLYAQALWRAPSKLAAE
jgi:FAD-dependent urate hydroxylase